MSRRNDHHKQNIQRKYHPRHRKHHKPARKLPSKKPVHPRYKVWVADGAPKVQPQKQDNAIATFLVQNMHPFLVVMGFRWYPFHCLNIILRYSQVGSLLLGKGTWTHTVNRQKWTVISVACVAANLVMYAWR